MQGQDIYDCGGEEQYNGGGDYYVQVVLSVNGLDNQYQQIYEVKCGKQQCQFGYDQQLEEVGFFFFQFYDDQMQLCFYYFDQQCDDVLINGENVLIWFLCVLSICYNQ